MPSPCVQKIYFNPRSREGSDVFSTLQLSQHAKFQSTLPRGERRWKVSEANKESLFQSTLPRGERPLLSAVYVLTVEISIHAPARGATNASAKKQTPLNISIHAPARGATESRVILQQGYTVFQSTLPRGERRVADSNKVEVKQISIHAPARGATKNYLVTVNRFYISIHAPARGATFVEKRAAYVEIFQSTLPRGERQHRLGGACSCHNFNPRSREGSDFNVYIKIIYHFYFNPRSREGSDS